jgi:hypothetical protein
MEVSVDQFKSGSSLTLGKYNTKLTEMLPPRWSRVKYCALDICFYTNGILLADLLNCWAYVAQHFPLRR